MTGTLTVIPRIFLFFSFANKKNRDFGSMSKYWLDQKQDDVSEWNNMSTIMYQWIVVSMKYKNSTKCVRVSELLLFNAKWAIFQLYHGENKLHFNEMMMTNMVSWIFIVLAHWINTQWFVGRHVAPLGHITCIPIQSVYALTRYRRWCCVLI